ncbi:MAG TPA: CHRD domain-containing protein [Firmicutes bacterium]|nr:CHRD domain-containing protein [Bacillota bacterium]
MGIERRFVANLSGANVVPPVVTTGTGTATFRWVKRRGHKHRRLLFNVTVTDLPNIIAINLQSGRPTENGPIIATLFLSELAGGTISPDLTVSGRIRQADLSGPFAGATLKKLIKAMARGLTYVQVYTFDLPNGALRGQVMEVPPVSLDTMDPPLVVWRDGSWSEMMAGMGENAAGF